MMPDLSLLIELFLMQFKSDFLNYISSVQVTNGCGLTLILILPMRSRCESMVILQQIFLSYDI